MKTVLAFGDSLTWGSDPAGGGRHPEAMRWPDALQASLGDRVRVIADGLRGRTTAYDEHLADCDRNGARILPTALYTHAPLDLVILMLGANDMKPHIAGTAVAALQGMRRLVAIVKSHVPGIEGAEPPAVLIVAPPPLCETADPFFAAMFSGGVEQSSMLASLYADLADEMDCGFFDAATVARAAPADGVHMDAENTRDLGRALAPMVHVMLGL
ncbi:arylesterase [Zhengella mangrovi]|uniref:Arylesterase n=1 Tax=Zhengella mangrovi TaxID=1982044 RepID=A0A2G1QQW3_9HYPH|nr:SGNH/GDSL hydrolase family protein [Zhengella mangrovi]PHP67871.1 arylesterase [Zhengella mangrovi]